MQEQCTVRIPLYARGGVISGYTTIDADDYEWASSYRWNLHKDGYAARSEYAKDKTVTWLLHRKLLNAPTEHEVDHINRNRLDNRRANLRLVGDRETVINHTLRSDNSSGYRGVALELRAAPRQWKAHVCVEGKQKTLGRFETKEEAARVRDRAAKQYYGEYAVLNFPEEN